MKILEKLSFSNNIKKIISIIFYVIFISFTIYQIIKTPLLLHKILFFILLVIIMGMAFWSEYLKYAYEKTIKTLAYDLDPINANNQYNKLLKLDKAHAYKNSKLIFDTLFYIDQMEYEKCLELLKDNYKFFHASLDQLLIYHFTNFYCSFMINDIDQAQEEYHKLLRMKGSKTKGNKVSPLYNWEFLDAVYQFSRKEYKKSFNIFKTVNTRNMNPREQVQYYLQFARLCHKIKENTLRDTYIKKVQDMNGLSNSCIKIEKVVKYNENEQGSR